MGMNKIDVLDELMKRRTSSVFDHFNEYVSGTGHLWTSAVSGGTVANNDGDGGILTLTTGAVADQDAAVVSTRKNWTFVADKPMLFQVGLRYTEANTDDAAIFAGFASSFTDILADATYLPPTNISACGIYKRAGGTLWRGFTSVGTTQTDTESRSSCIQAAIIQELYIYVAIVGSNLEATFWAGGPGPATITGGGSLGRTPMMPNVTTMARMQPIKHVIAYASAAAMNIGVYVKASSGNSEVVSVDYIGAHLLSIP